MMDKKILLLVIFVFIGCISGKLIKVREETGNGTVRFCEFPQYNKVDNCDYPIPNFSNRYNYTGTCEGGVWVLDGPIFAEPKRNITICGSSVRIRGQLIVPSTSSLLILENAKIHADCIFLYGEIHLHYGSRPEDDKEYKLDNFLTYDNCADFFTTKIKLFLDNTTIPCQSITISNTTTNVSLSLAHIGKNQCKSDYRVFVIIVSVLGAAILVAVTIYVIISIYQECCGAEEEEDDD